MAEHKKADEIVKNMTKKFEKKYGNTTIKGIRDVFNMCVNCVNQTPTADVVEVEKVAKILTDVTEKAPCEIVGANEWDYDYCNCAELCSQSNYEQCWVRYFKHCKERSEGNG